MSSQEAESSGSPSSSALDALELEVASLQERLTKTGELITMYICDSEEKSTFQTSVCSSLLEMYPLVTPIRPPPRDVPHFESRLRSPKNWIEYLRKEDPAPFQYGELPGSTPTYIDLGREGKTAEAIQAFVESHPLQYIVNKPRIEGNLASLAPKALPKAKFPSGWLGEAKNIFKFFAEDPQTKSLILSGGSGIGKTQLLFAIAQALGKRPLLVRHRDALKDFDPGDFLIFDDWDFGGWTRSEILHLIDCEEEAHVNVKHSYARIPGGTHRGFTTNLTYPEFFGPRFDPAIDRRVIFFDLGNDLLFHDHSE